jgi:hypothetical protein
MISQKAEQLMSFRSISMPESPDVEDYIHLGYTLLQNRKKDWQVKVTAPEAK